MNIRIKEGKMVIHKIFEDRCLDILSRNYGLILVLRKLSHL